MHGTFNAYTVTEAGVTQLSHAANVNGAAGSISLLFIVFAAGIRSHPEESITLTGWKEAVAWSCMYVCSICYRHELPADRIAKQPGLTSTFAYIFLAAVMPMWLLMQPRDYMTTFMFAGMIIGAVVGLVVAHPTMNLPVFTPDFNNAKIR